VNTARCQNIYSVDEKRNSAWKNTNNFPDVSDITLRLYCLHCWQVFGNNPDIRAGQL